MSVRFRALLASKDLSEPRELPDERLDSKKRHNTSSRLFSIPCTIENQVGLVAKEMRQADKSTAR